MKRIAIPGLNPNVGTTERIFSLLGGSYLMYKGFQKENKSITKTAFAGYLLFRGATGFCGLYNLMGKTKPDARSRNVNIQVTQVVDRPRKEVYEFWRQFENLPMFMGHLESVKNLNDHISVWKTEGPPGIGALTWKSEIVKERPNEFIGWQSLPGSAVENAGKVEFRDAEGFGTEVHIVISYSAPGGIAGEGAARLLNGVFKDLVREDLESFSRFMEEWRVPGIAEQSPRSFL